MSKTDLWADHSGADCVKNAILRFTNKINAELSTGEINSKKLDSLHKEHNAIVQITQNKLIDVLTLKVDEQVSDKDIRPVINKLLDCLELLIKADKIIFNYVLADINTRIQKQE